MRTVAPEQVAATILLGKHVAGRHPIANVDEPHNLQRSTDP